MGAAMEFARSKSEARKEGLTGVEFRDVAGLGPILGEVVEVVEVSWVVCKCWVACIGAEVGARKGAGLGERAWPAKSFSPGAHPDHSPNK